MRALLLLALASAVAHAQPAKSQRKAAPDKFTKAAGEAFTAALAADNQGDLRTALGLYQKAHAISPHPSTIYNIADVQRRLDMLRASIRSYETYLAMSPHAKDRREVEALIDQLAKTPGTLVIVSSRPSDPRSIDLATAFVLVDGKLLRRPGPITNVKPRNEPGIALQVPPGEHVVDVVTSLTYAFRDCDVGPGEQRICELEAEPRIDGTVVISGSNRQLDILTAARGKDLLYKRAELAPGKHRLHVKDRQYGCAPLAIDVAGGNTVTYAFVGTNEYEFKRCRKLDIQQHRLQFE
jgi:tetratricopeptide (TPR) repeat protein